VEIGEYQLPLLVEPIEDPVDAIVDDQDDTEELQEPERAPVSAA
jgi:hypothetical protein